VIESYVKENFAQTLRLVEGKSVYSLSPEMFVKKNACTKEKMGKRLVEVGKSLNFASELLKIANSAMKPIIIIQLVDCKKSDLKFLKNSIIKLKGKVVSIKNEDFQSVSLTV
jgi:hypothetical protein